MLLMLQYGLHLIYFGPTCFYEFLEIVAFFFPVDKDVILLRLIHYKMQPCFHSWCGVSAHSFYMSCLIEYMSVSCAIHSIGVWLSPPLGCVHIYAGPNTFGNGVCAGLILVQSPMRISFSDSCEIVSEPD